MNIGGRPDFYRGFAVIGLACFTIYSIEELYLYSLSAFRSTGTKRKSSPPKKDDTRIILFDTDGASDRRSSGLRESRRTIGVEEPRRIGFRGISSSSGDVL